MDLFALLSDWCTYTSSGDVTANSGKVAGVTLHRETGTISRGSRAVWMRNDGERETTREETTGPDFGEL